MNRTQQLRVGIHVVYALSLFGLAAFVAVSAGKDSTEETWPVTAAMILYPQAILVGLIGLAVVAGIRSWLRTGSRDLLFAADLAFPLFIVTFGLPLALGPFGERMLLVDFLFVLALVCGGFMAAAQRRRTTDSNSYR